MYRLAALISLCGVVLISGCAEWLGTNPNEYTPGFWRLTYDDCTLVEEDLASCSAHWRCADPDRDSGERVALQVSCEPCEDCLCESYDRWGNLDEQYCSQLRYACDCSGEVVSSTDSDCSAGPRALADSVCNWEIRSADGGQG